MDGLTRTLHDFIPTVFLVLKSRNKKQFDVAKHLLFQLQGTIEILIKTLNAEHREAIEKGDV